MNFIAPWFLIRIREQDADYYIHFGIYGKTQSLGWVKFKDKKYNLRD